MTTGELIKKLQEADPSGNMQLYFLNWTTDHASLNLTGVGKCVAPFLFGKEWVIRIDIEDGYEDCGEVQC